jgi:hypothetical protein
MPAKVQLKLLSNSGELLNVANCCAGKISVLRASTPSDLRPYQRVLSGSSGRDNLEILCDGAPFHPDEHILIGFGEPSPTTGLTVKEFATSRGISEFALSTQLISVGLDEVVDKRCAELSLDQEARLRLLAATGDPDKVIVLNDPFDNVSGKWRERMAELLADFARTRNALIIIPSLSYRPEAWIANDTIDRIEVGQTSQRTIGFGSAGSQSNAPIDDIRNQLRNDPRFAGQVAGHDSRASTSAAMAGLAAGIKTQDLDPMATGVAMQKSWLPTVGKLLFALVGSSVGGWALYTAVSMQTARSNNAPAHPQAVAMNQPAVTSQKPSAAPENKAVEVSDKVQKPPPMAAVNAPNKKTVAPQTEFILDQYPAVIKASILDTVRGTIDFYSPEEKAQVEQHAQKRADSGNLFSLLEAASNSKSEPANGYPGNSGYSASQEEASSVDTSAMSAEEAQREAIRNRFLEAIRASAARRQAEAEEQMVQ